MVSNTVLGIVLKKALDSMGFVLYIKVTSKGSK